MSHLRIYFAWAQLKFIKLKELNTWWRQKSQIICKNRAKICNKNEI